MPLPTPNDPLFLDPLMVELYDLQGSWLNRHEYDFYMPLIMSANSVLDVGCGTGELLRLARKNGHSGRLCGIDPAEPMLKTAREQADIEWVLGPASSCGWKNEFDLVIMTGHAIQVIIDLDEIQASLLAMRPALTRDGNFVFETRNPLLRDWENWIPDSVKTFTGPGGTEVKKWHEVEKFESDIVTYTTTYSSPAWPEDRVTRSKQLFFSADQLDSMLALAGFKIEQQFGNWNREPFTDQSPEIITVAGRA